ncbi:hypothetical protein LZ32DRAFT_440847 [Colletotrichum eremochloae]|nr:hypothetical protein LZ32DRAFT_440847 [Colletotrichum eremochloae]
MGSMVGPAHPCLAGNSAGSNMRHARRSRRYRQTRRFEKKRDKPFPQPSRGLDRLGSPPPPFFLVFCYAARLAKILTRGPAGFPRQSADQGESMQGSLPNGGMAAHSAVFLSVFFFSFLFVPTLSLEPNCFSRNTEEKKKRETKKSKRVTRGDTRRSG